MRKYLAVLALLGSLVVPAFAVDLMDIYEQAVENDPDFKNAFDVFQSNKENIAIARSVLYPQLSVTAGAGRNLQHIETQSQQGFLMTEGTFSSYQWTAQLTQALLNVQAWMSLKQAKAGVKAAHATFNDAAQQLMLRTSQAYFDVLLASDTLKFAEAKKRANKRQLDQAQQRFKVGLDAITSVYEAKAAYDQSVAEVIQAKNNRTNQRENLRKLTNHVYKKLSPLRNSRIPLIRPEPDNIDDWVASGLRQNFLLLAAKFNFQASRDNIRVQNSGHFPTINIQSNATDTRNLTGSNGGFFAPQRNISANLSVAVSLPVFQGGLVEANVRQAKYDYKAAGEQLEKTHRDVIVNSRIAFNTIIDGISKVKADRETVVSQRQSLESTEAQFQVGTRTMVDVVNAQQRLFNAQRELATNQYGLINAMLNLKYLAGSLNVNDLELVNSWLNTKRIYGYAPGSQKPGSMK